MLLIHPVKRTDNSPCTKIANSPYGKHITARNLLEKIYSEEFGTMNNKDALGLCLLGILELVLLGHELRNAVKWWEAQFATDRQPDSGRPKYSLMDFIWAFK
ncbi:hypothetical protein Tco_1481391, partial [Tanacetum coccineum]